MTQYSACKKIKKRQLSPPCGHSVRFAAMCLPLLILFASSQMMAFAQMPISLPLVAPKPQKPKRDFLPIRFDNEGNPLPRGVLSKLEGFKRDVNPDRDEPFRFSPDGKMFLMGTTFWDVQTGKVIAEAKKLMDMLKTGKVFFGHQGSPLVAGFSDRLTTFRIVDVKTGKDRLKMKVNQIPSKNFLQFWVSEDGLTVVVSSLISSKTINFSFLEPETGKIRAHSKLKIRSSRYKLIRNYAICGKRFCIAVFLKKLHVWDNLTGEHIVSTNYPRRQLQQATMKFKQEGDFLWIQSTLPYAHWLDIKGDSQFKKISFATRRFLMSEVKLSGNSRFISVEIPEFGKNGKRFDIYDVKKNKLYFQLSLTNKTKLNDFSKSGKYLVFTGSDVRLWDVTLRKNLTSLVTPEIFATNLLPFGVLSPDERLFIGSCEDRIGKNIYLYFSEVSTGIILKQVLARPVRFHRFSSDGKKFLTLDNENTALIWDLEFGADNVKPKTNDLPNLWNELSSDDLFKARRAILILSRSGSHTVGFLAERLKRDPADRGRFQSLVEELGNRDFKIRQRAEAGLRGMGLSITGLLKKQIERAEVSLETKKRLQKILDILNDKKLGSRDRQRVRVIEVLERIGSEKASELLKIFSTDHHESSPGAMLSPRSGVSMWAVRRIQHAHSPTGVRAWHPELVMESIHKKPVTHVSEHLLPLCPVQTHSLTYANSKIIERIK